MQALSAVAVFYERGEHAGEFVGCCGDMCVVVTGFPLRVPARDRRVGTDGFADRCDRRGQEVDAGLERAAVVVGAGRPGPPPVVREPAGAAARSATGESGGQWVAPAGSAGLAFYFF